MTEYFSQSQVIATSVKNLLLLNLGLCYALPSIVIPALTNIRNEPNSNEFLLITDEDASWLGKFMLLQII